MPEKIAGIELLDDPMEHVEPDPGYWTSELPESDTTKLLFPEPEDDFFDDGMTADPCPACGRPKRWKMVGSGRFLGCSAFPKCRWTSYRRTEEPCATP